MLVFGSVLPLGSTRLAGTVPSAFRTRNAESPPETSVPPRPVISLTFTTIVAAGLLETANTVREIPECAPIVTSIDVNGNGIPFTLVGSGDGIGVGGTNCENEAKPPTGWLAIVMRK